MATMKILVLIVRVGNLGFTKNDGKSLSEFSND
jgi:hypothetical protein